MKKKKGEEIMKKWPLASLILPLTSYIYEYKFNNGI